MNYAALNENFALRGFWGRPYVLVNMKTGQEEFLDKRNFFLLDFCDGTIDLDTMLLTKKEREAIALWKEKNILNITKEPRPIGERQYFRKAENFYIRSIHWSVTGRCNLNCRHCYMSAPGYKYKDMTKGECLGIVRQLSQANVQSVSITGGEPFLRDDLFEILDELHREGIAVSQIYTNGTLLTPEILDWFDAKGHKPQFVLSYDGVGSHDWMRGQEGAEEEVLKTIGLLKDRGYFVMIETALSEKSISSLDDTYRLLKEQKVDYWKTSMVFEAGRWKETMKDFRNGLAGQEAAVMNPGDSNSIVQETVSGKFTVGKLYKAYLKLIQSYVKDNAPMDMQLDGFFACRCRQPKQWRAPYHRTTGCGENGFSCMTCFIHPYLLPDGTLLPCATMTDSEAEARMPNLNRTTLEAIYKSYEHPFFWYSNPKVNEILESNEECRSCPYRVSCGGGCRGMSLVENRGRLGHSGILCEFFKGGYELMIDETVKNAVQKAKEKGGKKMNSMESLKKLTQENQEAAQKLRNIIDMPQNEAVEALSKFVKEYDIELEKEEFSPENMELSGQDLDQVSGGAEALDWVSLGLSIYQLFPPSTGRGTTNGTKRFNKK